MSKPVQFNCSLPIQPINKAEKEFYQDLLYKMRIIGYYENSTSLHFAKTCIPTDEIKTKATLKLSMVDEEDEVDLDDLILLELLDWFKCDFFKWVDSIKCESCNMATQNEGMLPPTINEKEWDAQQVEGYFCSKCSKHFRFPRYNNPQKLLDTREGRCGEWANAFTLLCVALGYEARLISDWTDHAWTEVYSNSKKCWLHCDPCENVCDKPLLYEAGWKKKLTYIIAFSKYEVQDVTWRYTSDFESVLKRRNYCREEFVLGCISAIQKRLEQPLKREVLNKIYERRARELACFFSPAQPENESYSGRTSGSLAWRIARSESGFASTQSAYVFKLIPEEIEQRHFHVQYCSASDKYIRANTSINIEGWMSCTFSHRNIFRKVENDWKMVYLAPTEGSKEGNISWKFDFQGHGLVISKIKMNLMSKTFDCGNVRWLLFPNPYKESPVHLTAGIHPIEITELAGTTGFTLTAELIAGDKWQNAQIFRQSLDSTTIFPFEVEIRFEEHKENLN